METKQAKGWTRAGKSTAGRVRDYFHLSPKPDSATYQLLMVMLMWFICNVRL